jgi:voltage-gated potassium channel
VIADDRRRRRPRLSLHERARRAAASGRVIPYLAASIAGLAVLTGFISTLVDRKDFPTLGDGIWWAIVTLGTVGYGDIVPHTGWGRVLGSIVIVFGVTFISLLFATVTSFLVSSDQAEAVAAQEQRDAEGDETRALLMEIASRLTAIESELASLRRTH